MGGPAHPKVTDTQMAFPHQRGLPPNTRHYLGGGGYGFGAFLTFILTYVYPDCTCTNKSISFVTDGSRVFAVDGPGFRAMT